MNSTLLNRLALSIALSMALLLQACGGGETATVADQDKTRIEGTVAGATPFIAYADLAGLDFSKVDSIGYTIAAMPGTASKPVQVTFNAAHLQREGWVVIGSPTVRVPIFGLYAEHVNRVELTLAFNDGSARTLVTDLTTGAHTGANAIYLRPTVLTPRNGGTPLGYSFFYIRSGLGTPVVIDSDGHMRWSGVRSGSSTSSIWTNNGFIVGAAGSTVSRYELDGRTSTFTLTQPRYYQFHHNIDAGATGLLGEFDVTIDAGQQIESVLAEFDTSGKVLKEWDFATIFADHMTANGDDPSKFVVRTRDWFHINAATYDARDRSIIASSRENFLVKIDYDTGRILWLLGDPTKYWFTFPSLRAKAIALPEGDLYPIGQHAVSITPDGLIQVFNNGLASLNQPAGAPTGESRLYSTASTYAVDVGNRTGREVRRFDNGRSVFSDICSSAYTQADGSQLLSYAAASNRKQARLIGLSPDGTVAFDYAYPSAVPCQASFNADVLRLEALRFD